MLKVAQVVLRFPVTGFVLVSEAALVLGALGTPPSALWRVLSIPAYLAHLALALVFVPSYWVHLGVTLGAAFLFDWAAHRWAGGGGA